MYILGSGNISTFAILQPVIFNNELLPSTSTMNNKTDTCTGEVKIINY